MILTRKQRLMNVSDDQKQFLFCQYGSESDNMEIDMDSRYDKEAVLAYELARRDEFIDCDRTLEEFYKDYDRRYEGVCKYCLYEVINAPGAEVCYSCRSRGLK